MEVRTDIAQRTDHMVRDCGLDSASIFLCDKTSAQSRLSYLYHVGVSQESQHAYEQGRVFDDDPFARVMDCASPSGKFFHWQDEQLRAVADRAPDYRQFIGHYAIDVVGAHVRQLVPNLYLLVGVHRKSRNRFNRCPVDIQLENETVAVANMVVIQLLEETLTQPNGRIALDSALQGTNPATPPTVSGETLSMREKEIARLICQGKQNKEIAFRIGLSEYTVENHLRRIYRKLGIHNRAAMVARFSADSIH
jgi:DNA-binding CsgD family transcriptional regulator